MLTFTIEIQFSPDDNIYRMRIEDTKFGRHAWINISKDFAKSMIDTYDLVLLAGMTTIYTAKQD